MTGRMIFERWLRVFLSHCRNRTHIQIHVQSTIDNGIVIVYCALLLPELLHVIVVQVISLPKRSLQAIQARIVLYLDDENDEHEHEKTTGLTV